MTSDNFTLAANYLSNSSLKVSTAVKLEIYGLFKLVTASQTPAGSRPSLFDLTGRAKWDAWDAAAKNYGGNDGQSRAERHYIEIAEELGFKKPNALVVDRASTSRSKDTDSDDVDLDRLDEDEPGQTTANVPSGFGGGVSSMSHTDPTPRNAQSLHEFALEGNCEALRNFCSKNPDIDIDARDAFGYTALHLAADRGNAEAVEFLLSSGADSEAMDGDNCTTLDLASAAGHASVVEVLQNWDYKKSRRKI